MKTLGKREINGEQLRAIVGQLGDDWLIMGDAVPIAEVALFEKLWKEGA